MKALTRVVATAALGLCAASAIWAQHVSQSPKESSKPVGSISGRVTIAGKPARGVTMILYASESGPGQPFSPSATTDEDGHFKISGVAAGRYTVLPVASAHVGPKEGEYGQPGRMITIDEGEAVEGLDFALTRGGVITGRVTDSEGRPVIAQMVHLYQVDERTKRHNPFYYPSQYETDDRGVYRVYGLPSGRYLVAVGDASDGSSLRIGSNGGYYTHTYHPDAADPSKATSIEVQAGSEATGIDIRIGNAARTYVATGRIVDAETGRPVANMMYGPGTLNSDSTRLAAFGYTNQRTDATGQLRITGLSPGRYSAFAVPDDDSGFYSEPALFEVTDQDVSGLQIKVRRGATIIGKVVLEGTSDPEVFAKLSGLELSAYVIAQGIHPPNQPMGRIAPDGSFRITGLRAGLAKLGLYTFPQPKGLSIARIERDGADQTEGLEIEAGEQVAGVKVVIAYGTGMIRGQVRIEGGELPEGITLSVSVQRVGGRPEQSSWSTLDVRRRFLLEGLTPGDYVVTLQVTVPFGMRKSFRFNPPRQTVSIAQAGEYDMVLVLDLSEGRKDGEEGKR